MELGYPFYVFRKSALQRDSHQCTFDVTWIVHNMGHPEETIFMNCQSLCCVINMKYIVNLSSVEFSHIQLTLVISTSLISNNRLSRSENLIPA